MHILGHWTCTHIMSWVRTRRAFPARLDLISRAPAPEYSRLLFLADSGPPWMTFWCHYGWACPGWGLHGCCHSHYCHPERLDGTCKRTRTRLQRPSGFRSAASRVRPPCGTAHPSPRALGCVRARPALWEVVLADHRPAGMPSKDLSTQLFPSCRTQLARVGSVDAA